MISFRTTAAPRSNSTAVRSGGQSVIRAIVTVGDLLAGPSEFGWPNTSQAVSLVTASVEVPSMNAWPCQIPALRFRVRSVFSPADTTTSSSAIALPRFTCSRYSPEGTLNTSESVKP